MGRLHDRPQRDRGKLGAIAITTIMLAALVALLVGGGAQAVTPPTVLLGTADQLHVHDHPPTLTRELEQLDRRL